MVLIENGDSCGFSVYTYCEKINFYLFKKCELVCLFVCLFVYMLIAPIVALVFCSPSCVYPGGIQLFPELGNQLHSI